MQESQFNTYDSARIHSHPGISTELSRASPEEILVTDFFGGVASVEVMGKEGMLPVLGRKLGQWEPIDRVRSRAEVGYHLDNFNRTQRFGAGSVGWVQPLLTHDAPSDALRGTVVATILAMAAYAWMGAESELKTD